MSGDPSPNPAFVAFSTGPTAPPGRKQVLFVDDEPAILDLFSLMFGPNTTDWQASFATSGAEALALIEKHPFDVVVSDMRMPGMNGVQLLEEVRKRSPATARLILSGYADEEEVANSVGAAHQFLRKPCDSLALRSTLTRVCALDVFLRNEKLKALASKMTVLPSVPAVYFRVLKELQSPLSSAESIGEIVAQDPCMTAKLLQLVNSAFFGISRKVSNPAEAVQLLGINTVRSLALSIHAFACFDQSHLPGFSIERLWNHSVRTGMLSRRIAQWAQAGAGLADEAFVSGLLHDLGKLMLAANLAAQYRQALARAAAGPLPLHAAEREVFEACHADVGAYLLGLWGLPVGIVEAVALHHQPAKSITRTFTPLTAVHVANVLEHEASPGPPEGAPSQLDQEYLKECGVADRLDDWRTRQLAA